MRKHKPPFDSAWLAEAMLSRPNTPDGKSGNISIESTVQPAGEPLTVVSYRNAIFMGQQPCKVRFDVNLTYRSLKSDEHGIWMTDSAQEVYQCRDAINAVADRRRCKLLLGGLGLGVYSALALRMTDAAVTTVERDDDVVRLVEPHVRNARHTVRNGCIYQYAKQLTSKQYDIALLDVWQSTGEFAWQDEVIPLRRLVRPKVETVFCWNEQEMIGQYLMGIYRKLILGLSCIPAYDNHYRAVLLAAHDEGIDIPAFDGQLTADNANELFTAEAAIQNRADITEIANAFAHDIGSLEWEERFGAHWDRAMAMGKKQERALRRKWQRRQKAKT